jgi:MFS family permease
MQKTTPLFVASVVALVTTSFGFIVRAFLITEWSVQFNLSETQVGALQGAGLFPFALSIILFSLVIDRLGYGRVMVFAWVGHVVSAVLTITAHSYAQLYLGTLLFALANGAIEAVVNPVTTTLFPKDKTNYLNILHAGWPGGLVIGGLSAIALGGVDWRLKVGIFLIPAVIYGLMMLRCKFPVHERVAAGVPYMDMLGEFGWAGCLIVSYFGAQSIDEVMRVFDTSLAPWMIAVLTLAPTALFAVKVRKFGRPMFVFLLVVMVLLATTELGTDSWIAALMTPVLKHLGPNGGNWVLVYTSALMFVLRFYAGPLVHRLSPLGLLATCAVLAAAGLLALSNVTSALAIFLAATLYGVGKTFFWPTTLGVVSEQFPRGGALTLNAMGGVGMMAVGVLGAPFFGTMQDKMLDSAILADSPALHASVTTPAQHKFGLEFRPLDQQKAAALPAADRAVLDRLKIRTNQATLARVALLPIIMFVCYVGLLLHFRRRGGYRAVNLEAAATPSSA